MKRKKSKIGKLVSDAAFVATITLINRCLETKDRSMVKRDGDEKELSRKLSLVNIVYHMVGVFYNE